MPVWKNNKHRLPLILSFPTQNFQWSHTALKSPHFLMDLTFGLKQPSQPDLPLSPHCEQDLQSLKHDLCLHQWPLTLQVLSLSLFLPLLTFSGPISSLRSILWCSTRPPTVRRNSSDYVLYTDALQWTMVQLNGSQPDRGLKVIANQQKLCSEF